MICGICQGLIIKKNRARTPRKINECRRALREHVKTCEFCKKNIMRRSHVEGIHRKKRG